MGTIIGQIDAVKPAAVGTPAALETAREVVRCGECSLVQFRTASDKCRRCSKPLPSLAPAPVEERAADTEAGLDPFIDLDGGAPIARAERNRRVGMGARLRACRIKMGLTQIEMAEKLNIPRTYLSRIENDRLLPGPLMIAKFAADLGLNVSDVLPSLQSQLDSDRRWDGISRRIINLFNEMPAEQQQAVVSAARSMLESGQRIAPAGMAQMGAAASAKVVSIAR